MNELRKGQCIFLNHVNSNVTFALFTKLQCNGALFNNDVVSSHNIKVFKKKEKKNMQT